MGGTLCVGFVRGDDLRYPAFGDERLAISFMADWLRRGRASRNRARAGIMRVPERADEKVWVTRRCR